MRRTRHSSRRLSSTNSRQTKKPTDRCEPEVAALLTTSSASRQRPVTRRSSATTSFSAAATRKSRPGQVRSSRSRGDGVGSSGGGYRAARGGVRRLVRGGAGSRERGMWVRPNDNIADVKLPDAARFSTICIHAGQEPDPSTGAIITPIFQTSTYVQEELGKHKGYEYARTQNPTRFALERNIAAIEGGKAAFAFASGHGGDRRDHDAAEVGRPRRRHRQHLRRHVPAVRQGADAVPARVQLRRHVAAAS